MLWQNFFPRLSALARKTLAGRPQRVTDADDAVQSALASFFQRAAAGDFGQLVARDELWRLLATITVRKSQQQVRREMTAKRGGGQILSEAQLGANPDQPRRLEDLAAVLPAQEFDLRCEELLGRLGDELRQFALLRLLGYQNREIADQFACTERKVERKLQLIRLHWQDELES